MIDKRAACHDSPRKECPNRRGPPSDQGDEQAREERYFHQLAQEHHAERQVLPAEQGYLRRRDARASPKASQGAQLAEARAPRVQLRQREDYPSYRAPGSAHEVSAGFRRATFVLDSVLIDGSDK